MPSSPEAKKARKDLRKGLKDVFDGRDTEVDVVELARALWRKAGGMDQLASRLWEAYDSSDPKSQYAQRMLSMCMTLWTTATPNEEERSRFKNLSDAELEQTIKEAMPTESEVVKALEAKVAVLEKLVEGYRQLYGELDARHGTDMPGSGHGEAEGFAGGESLPPA